MIYLDSSVALAHFFEENHAPPPSVWDEELVSSRLLEYEIWNRVHARRFARSYGDEVSALIARVSLIELSPAMLARAIEPFPVPVRTLDALHLASIDYLRAQGQPVELASYDNRLLAAARALRIGIAPL